MSRPNKDNNESFKSIKEAREFFLAENYILLATVYRNQRQPLEMICPNGHYITITLEKWKKGSRCRLCNRKSPIIQGMKKCVQCGNWKSVRDFSHEKRSGYSSKCKKCLNQEKWNRMGYRTRICDQCGREFNTNKEDKICKYCKITKIKPSWRGGSRKKGLVSKETFLNHSNKIPEIEYRESSEHKNMIEVKCEHCNGFFLPRYIRFYNRVRFGTLLLCSDKCKSECPNFGNDLLQGKIIQRRGSDNPCWKGGEYEVIYESYKEDLEWTGEIKDDGNGYLEAQCSYCEEWFYPTRTQVYMRRRGLEEGKGNFYCSDKCKVKCPIYRQRYYRKDNKPVTNRELQDELKEIVLERDEYACVKCGSKKGLICHHIEGLHWEPVESADEDICVTVCKDCHEEIHRQPGCKKNQLGCKRK